MTLPHEWLSGWDPTPGIVSIHAEPSGHATVWRRIPATGQLVTEQVRFQPWMLLDAGLPEHPHITQRELSGPGALRYFASASDTNTLTNAVLERASHRLGRPFTHISELGKQAVLALPPEEQYLVSTGRTYFRDLTFDQLHRLQFDLETTGLNPDHDRIFMIAVRHANGATETLEGTEPEIIRALIRSIRDSDPDVIENHNLHGFDLPFLNRRARILGIPLTLGRFPGPLRQRAARRGAASSNDPTRHIRFVAPGRELIDTLDAVLRYDFSARDLPGHGLKAVARHLGIAAEDREQIPGDQIYTVYQRDPARVRRYALSDVEEVAHLAKMLGGAAFALAQMTPRRYERLADAGAATGVIDPLLVHQDVRERQQERCIAPGKNGNMLVRLARRFGAPRVHDHHFAAALANGLQSLADVGRGHEAAIRDSGIRAQAQEIGGAVNVGNRNR